MCFLHPMTVTDIQVLAELGTKALLVQCTSKYCKNDKDTDRNEKLN